MIQGKLLIGHRKDIQKPTFRVLDLHQSESRPSGSCGVYMTVYMEGKGYAIDVTVLDKNVAFSLHIYHSQPTIPKIGLTKR